MFQLHRIIRILAYVNALKIFDQMCLLVVLNHLIGVSYIFPVFRLLNDFVCLFTYEFCLSLWKIALRFFFCYYPYTFLDKNVLFVPFSWRLIKHPALYQLAFVEIETTFYVCLYTRSYNFIIFAQVEDCLSLSFVRTSVCLSILFLFTFLYYHLLLCYM